MTDYLKERKQRVIVNGEYSKWTHVQSGVPQGATLGPLNFLLFVNDLPDSLSLGTHCGIFADDTKILRHIITDHDVKTLQNDIDNLHNWSLDWGLNFNTSKCKVIIIKKTHMTDNLVYPHYTMDGLELEHTDDMQDLGVMVDNKLTWINHIYKTIRKSHARAWLCMRPLGFHAYRKAKKACYITMVRSIMEYASPIWSPTYKYLLVATESVQRRATNYILKNPKRPNPLHINYKERLLQLNLLPLTYRREIIDLQTFLKIWNSNNKLGLQNVLSFSEPNQGRITRAMARERPYP